MYSFFRPAGRRAGMLAAFLAMLLMLVGARLVATFDRRGSTTPSPESVAPEERYYAAQLHLHGPLSEGVGTMRGHNMAARQVGVEILWWTDHDWRIARHTHLTAFQFEIRRQELEFPPRNQPWRKSRPIIARWEPRILGQPLVEHAARLTDAVAGRGRSLEVRALAAADAGDWGWSEVQMTATAGRARVALAADVVLRLAAHLVTPPGPDAETLVRLELSRQIDGIAELWYVLGPGGERRVVRGPKGRIGIVPVDLPVGIWGEIELPVTRDAFALALGGWDNSLRALRLGVRARRGGLAAARFDDLRIVTELEGNEVLARQELMAFELEKEFGLVNHVGLEISYSLHMGAYLPRAELPDFERDPGGMSPRQIVDWVHERDGVVSYNHIFGTGQRLGLKRSVTSEVKKRIREQARAMAVDNRIFGADLLEVGYPQRVEPLVAHLAVWDELSAARVFLTAIGSSDSHDHELGWSDGNNFITWIWAKSPRAVDLIEGLREGRAFLGDPTRFHGSLDLESEEGYPMGRVVRTRRATDAARLRLVDVPEGATLRWIVDGQEAGRLDLPTGDFETFLRLDVDRYRYVRAELWQGQHGLAFSNCLYFVPAAEAKPPATNRLVGAR